MSWLEAEPGPEEEGVPRGAEETKGAKGARGRLASGPQGTSLEGMLQLSLLSWAPLPSPQSSGSALPSLSK